MLVIRTTKPSAEIRRLIHNIPDILAGRAPDPQGFRDAFWGAVAHHIFSKVSEAFLAKSNGGTDELGNSWDPLRKPTIQSRLKPSRIRKHPLSAELRIMRVSDRLLRSLLPGAYNGYHYSPPEDQLFRVENGNVVLGSLVEYAPAQAKLRPIFPPNINRWIKEAVAKGSQAIIQRFHSFL